MCYFDSFKCSNSCFYTPFKSLRKPTSWTVSAMYKTKLFRWHRFWRVRKFPNVGLTRLLPPSLVKLTSEWVPMSCQLPAKEEHRVTLCASQWVMVAAIELMYIWIKLRFLRIITSEYPMDLNVSDTQMRARTLTLITGLPEVLLLTMGFLVWKWIET